MTMPARTAAALGPYSDPRLEETSFCVSSMVRIPPIDYLTRMGTQGVIAGGGGQGASPGLAGAGATYLMKWPQMSPLLAEPGNGYTWLLAQEPPSQPVT